MALTADKEVLIKGSPVIQNIPVAATAVIYKGAMVKINAGGYAAPCAPEAGSTFAGIALSGANNLSGANGAIDVQVARTNSHLLTAAGQTQANVGDTVFATTDDATVGATAANAQKVGVVVEFVSATAVYVDIAGGTQVPALG